MIPNCHTFLKFLFEKSVTIWGHGLYSQHLFFKSSKFWQKLEIFDKYRNFEEKIEILTNIFCPFLRSKIEILVKTETFFNSLKRIHNDKNFQDYARVLILIPKILYNP